MAYTITRVELHDARYPSDYQALHKAMEQRGFQRYFDANGTRYYLPEAEYIKWDGTAASDLKLAESAVSVTGKTAAIFVSYVTDSMNSGLRAERLRNVS